MTTILQLSDLHIGPHNDEKIKTYDLIHHMMTHYQPDITVLTGDQIWSEGVIDSGRVYKKLMEYLNRYDTQIATTFGNHDTEGISNVQTYALLRTNILPTMYRKS